MVLLVPGAGLPEVECNLIGNSDISGCAGMFRKQAYLPWAGSLIRLADQPHELKAHWTCSNEAQVPGCARFCKCSIHLV